MRAPGNQPEHLLNDWTPCADGCQGYGPFTVDRPPFLELQRCDCCERFPDDDAAAAQFVRDLENGDAYALEIAQEFLDTAEDRQEATAQYGAEEDAW